MPETMSGPLFLSVAGAGEVWRPGWVGRSSPAVMLSELWNEYHCQGPIGTVTVRMKL